MAEPDDEQRDDEDQLDEQAAAAAAAVAALAALIGDDVERALSEPDEERRSALFAALAVTAFTLAYEQAGGTGSSAEEARAYVFSLRPAFGLLRPDGSDAQQERMTDIIAHSATSAGTLAAAVDNAGPDSDLKFEWRTMRDDRVRDMHRPVDGQMRAGLEPFDVGGHPQRYPGHPVGPPEAWINCRCFLLVHPLTAAAEGDGMEPRHDHHEDDGFNTELLAASDTPWSQFSAADYSIQQWKRACILTMPGGDPDAKSTYKLPIREPGGALNVNGVHAAASRFGQTHAPAEAKAAAKAKLRGAYKQIGEEAPDSLKADADTLVAWPKSTSPPGTHDAPGWLTNPRETQRLRTYWTKGAGAAKIGWGSPNDLTRCAHHLAKYVAPEHVWGTCQNLHKEALGYWNPESKPSGRSSAEQASLDLITAAFTAAATLEDDMDTTLTPPLEWFQDPGFDAPTPLTITADGRVLGHLASWDTCHVGITGDCVTPPRSNTGYAHFRTGEIETADGTLVAVGQITMDTGHAGADEGPQAAVSHYDNTGTGVADVAAGEDDHGIWVAGAMRPGISEQQMYALKATGALSGDWRRIGGNLELVAALAVNVPGFPIPRVAMAASAGRTYALVAAAVVTSDPNALDVDRIAIAVTKALDDRDATKARQLRATALTDLVKAERVDAVLSVLG